ncbi:MAG: DUF5092 domain-containing protein [Candidatus Dependentiae bacterium]
MKKSIFICLLIFQCIFSADHGDHEKPMIVRGKVVSHLNLDREEPILDIVFKKHIKENDQKGLASIVARVKSDNQHVIYYDAYQLNNLVFGQDSVGPLTKRVEDPQSKKLIDEIRYFILHSEHDPSFVTIGSTSGMQQPNRRLFVQTVLYANNPNVLPKDRALAHVEVGRKYALGHGVNKADAQNALYWYQKAIDQEVNKRAQARANYGIAKVYHQGLAGVQKDYAKAAEYYRKVIDQFDSIGSREWGKFNLARILELGGHGLKANWSEALPLYLDLAQYATIPEVKKQASNVTAIYYLRTEELKKKALKEYSDENRHLPIKYDSDAELSGEGTVARPEDDVAPGVDELLPNDDTGEHNSPRLKESLGS